MSKKTERKNRTDLVVNWPKPPYFTIIDDLFPMNSAAKHITLRVRLAKEIEAGNVACIGQITGAQGRPKKVFAFTPVPQSTRELAKSNHIQPLDEVKSPKLTPNLSVNTFMIRPKSVVPA